MTVLMSGRGGRHLVFRDLNIQDLPCLPVSSQNQKLTLQKSFKTPWKHAEKTSIKKYSFFEKIEKELNPGELDYMEEIGEAGTKN